MEQTNEAVEKDGGAGLKKDRTYPSADENGSGLFPRRAGGTAARPDSPGCLRPRLDTFWPGSSVLRHDVSGLTAAEAARQSSGKRYLPETGLPCSPICPGGGRRRQGIPAPLGIPPCEGFAPSRVPLSRWASSWTPRSCHPDRLRRPAGTCPPSGGDGYRRSPSEPPVLQLLYPNTLLRLQTQKADAAAEAAAAALSQAPTDTSYALGDDTLHPLAGPQGRHPDRHRRPEGDPVVHGMADNRTLKAGYAIARKTLTAEDQRGGRAGEKRRYDAKTGSVIRSRPPPLPLMWPPPRRLDGAARARWWSCPPISSCPPSPPRSWKRCCSGTCWARPGPVGGTAARTSNVRLSAAANWSALP